MASLVIVQRDDITPIRPVNARALPEFDDATRCLKRHYFPRSDEGLELFEVEYEPEVVVSAHAHSSAEIIYVTEGELRFGAKVCGPGSAIFVDARTLYRFRTGANGASFLNFRGTPSPGFLTKEGLLAEARSAAP